MKSFHMEGDTVRLYFTNYELRSDNEEFEEIVSILKKHNVKQLDYMMEPDCDLVKCEISDVRFDLIRTIDGCGSFLYCDCEKGMRFLESIFDMR